jgi:DNA-binding Lrp family transcriptional regulator
MKESKMVFRIKGLSPEPFRHLYGLSDDELATQGVKRYVANTKPGFPDRVEMRDGEPGETFLLINHVCQPANTPYRATHAIFVREGAEQTFDQIDEVPEVMRVRLLSLRAYDDEDMMVDADVVDGMEIESLIERLFSNPKVAYIHAHNAKRGCFSGRIDRA